MVSRMRSTPDHVLFEEKVCTAVGGQLTPGSGNKSIKGDVRLKSGWVFECKHTVKSIITIQKLWLTKLEKELVKDDVCLVIGFNMCGYPYFFEGPCSFHKKYSDWKTKTVQEHELPTELYTENGQWKLGKWSDLFELKD